MIRAIAGRLKTTTAEGLHQRGSEDMVLNIGARPEAKRAVYCAKALGWVSETKRQTDS